MRNLARTKTEKVKQKTKVEKIVISLSGAVVYAIIIAKGKVEKVQYLFTSIFTPVLKCCQKRE